MSKEARKWVGVHVRTCMYLVCSDEELTKKLEVLASYHLHALPLIHNLYDTQSMLVQNACTSVSLS